MAKPYFRDSLKVRAARLSALAAQAVSDANMRSRNPGDKTERDYIVINQLREKARVFTEAAYHLREWDKDMSKESK